MDGYLPPIKSIELMPDAWDPEKITREGTLVEIPRRLARVARFDNVERVFILVTANKSGPLPSTSHHSVTASVLVYSERLPDVMRSPPSDSLRHGCDIGIMEISEITSVEYRCKQFKLRHS